MCGRQSFCQVVQLEGRIHAVIEISRSAPLLAKIGGKMVDAEVERLSCTPSASIFFL
jgi:hypothetical protein